VVFEFAGRSGRDVQETLEFSIAPLTASFRNIRRNRRRTPADLTDQAVDFLLRESRGTAITGKSECMCLFPNDQNPENSSWSSPKPA